jgi:hypothetical protein
MNPRTLVHSWIVRVPGGEWTKNAMERGPIPGEESGARIAVIDDLRLEGS